MAVWSSSSAGAGVPLRTLQGWTGHGDIKTTAVYMHFAPAIIVP